MLNLNNSLTISLQNSNDYNNEKKTNLNFKRNFLFLKDIKYFSKIFYIFFKNLKNQIDINFLDLKIKSNLNKTFFFIAETKDLFFYNLFLALSKKFYHNSFFFEWNISKFFFFFKKKKNSSSNFFPIFFIAPTLLMNYEFMHSLKSLNYFPTFFFLEFELKNLIKKNLTKNVFPIFLSKKNNLKFLLTFFKILIKIL